MKRKMFVIQRLTENIRKLKDLWTSLKSLGLPSKKDSLSKICLEKDESITSNSKTNAEIFKEFLSNLTTVLLKKHPTPTNKFRVDSVSIITVFLRLSVRGAYSKIDIFRVIFETKVDKSKLS